MRFAQSYILGGLRHLIFFSLAECNAAIREVLMQMNRSMRRLGISRRQLFEAIERPLLRRLPATEYVYAEWRLTRVGLDDHVEVESFFYSVPHGLIRQQVDLCITAHTIEVFHSRQARCRYARRYGNQRYGTDPEHMSSAHRRYAEWTPEGFQRWGQTIGTSTEGMIIAISPTGPERGFRT